MNSIPLFLCTLLTVVLWEASTVFVCGRVRWDIPRRLLRITAVLLWLTALTWALVNAIRLSRNPIFTNTRPLLAYQLAFTALTVMCVALFHLFIRLRPAQKLPSLSLGFAAVCLLGIMLVVDRNMLVQRDRQARQIAADAYRQFENGLDRLPAGHDELDAAALYLQAIRRMGSSPRKDFDRADDFAEDVTPPNDPQALAYLHQQESTLQLLRVAAAQPTCRFPDDSLYPQCQISLSQISYERSLAILLAADARAARLSGDVPRAIGDADTILRMSRQFAKRPILVSDEVAIGVRAWGLESLRKTLPAVKTAGDLAPLDGQSLSLPVSALQQSLRGEEVFLLAMLYTVPPAELHTLQLSGPFENPTIQSFDLRRAIAISPYDLAGIDQRFQTWQQLATIPNYQLPRPGPTHDHGIVINFPRQMMYGMLSLWNQTQANNLCAQAAVAMTRYRLDHGTLPSSLIDLVPNYLPAVPTDPFSGKPIRLVRRPGKWIIYSVGPNGIDDGGVFDPRAGHDDVVFELDN